MKILYRNRIDDFDPFASSSEAANYVAANVKIHHLVVPWRTTSAAAQYYTIDAGEGNTIIADCAAIAGHNLTSGGAIIKIQAHTTDAWVAPDLDMAIPWNAATMMVFFSSIARRFWRFYVDDPTNPNGYIQIGRLGLGQVLQMPPIEPGPKLPVIDLSEVSTSPGGQVFGNEGQLLLAPAFSFPIVSQAEREAILQMFAYVKKIRPLFLAVWEESLEMQAAIYCRINQDELRFEKSAEAGVLWTLELAFREVK